MCVGETWVYGERMWMSVEAQQEHVQFLFLRTFFKVKFPPELDALGIFCVEDGMRTLPNSELIGLTDWWNPAKAFGDVGPVGKNPILGVVGS